MGKIPSILYLAAKLWQKSLVVFKNDNENNFVHGMYYVPRWPSGSVSKMATGTGGCIVDAGGGAAEKTMTHYMYIGLVYLKSLLPEWLSGSVLGVTIGIGGGRVDEEMGTTGRRIN